MDQNNRINADCDIMNQQEEQQLDTPTTRKRKYEGGNQQEDDQDVSSRQIKDEPSSSSSSSSNSTEATLDVSVALRMNARFNDLNKIYSNTTSVNESINKRKNHICMTGFINILSV